MTFEEDISHCLKVLREGGVLLYPTDTVWGLGCDATNENAIAKIYKIKNRNDSKALIVLAATERQVMKYTAAVDLSLFDYLETTEKPTTVIYEYGLGFPDNLTAEDSSIGIRICRDDFCKMLIKRFGKPIVSTSANISGQPTPQVFKEINQSIIHAVDYVVKYRQDDMNPALASSIIRWNDGEIEFIRK